MNIAKVIRTLPPFFKRHKEWCEKCQKKVINLLLYIWPKSSIQLVQFNGSARLFADISDPFIQYFFINQIFDPEFFPITSAFLAKGGVFFDVGSSFGFCSFGMMNCLSGQEIKYHLFEANTRVCRIVLQSKNLYPNQKIYVNHCCVSDKRGISGLKIIKNHVGNSYISSSGEQEVNNLVIDEYVKDNSIERINFLKMDIEGYEPVALKGAFKTLSSGKVDAVYLEVSTNNLSRLNFHSEECFSLLRKAGFELFYCKNVDFEKGVAGMGKAFILNINGYSLVVANMDSFPASHQTDILAVHKHSGFLQNTHEGFGY